MLPNNFTNELHFVPSGKFWIITIPKYLMQTIQSFASFSKVCVKIMHYDFPLPCTVNSEAENMS